MMFGTLRFPPGDGAFPQEIPSVISNSSQIDHPAVPKKEMAQQAERPSDIPQKAPPPCSAALGASTRGSAAASHGP